MSSKDNKNICLFFGQMSFARNPIGRKRRLVDTVLKSIVDQSTVGQMTWLKLCGSNLVSTKCLSAKCLSTKSLSTECYSDNCFSIKGYRTVFFVFRQKQLTLRLWHKKFLEASNLTK